MGKKCHLTYKRVVNQLAARDDDTTPKKETPGSDFMEFIEQVLANIEAHDLPYRYLVMDNAAIHRTTDVKDWITERGFEIIYLPPYSPFLNPIEEFWSKLKDVVNKDPASVRLNTKLSDCIKKASEYIFREDCQAWIKHSLTYRDRCLAGEKKIIKIKKYFYMVIFLNTNKSNKTDRYYYDSFGSYCSSYVLVCHSSILKL